MNEVFSSVILILPSLGIFHILISDLVVTEWGHVVYRYFRDMVKGILCGHLVALSHHGLRLVPVEDVRDNQEIISLGRD